MGSWLELDVICPWCSKPGAFMLVKPRKTDNDVYRCTHCRLIFSPALQQEETEPPGYNRP